MEDFNFSYDKNSDDLFVYLKDKKSAGAVELGNIILDFDENSNLVAMQIINVSEFLSKIFSKTKMRIPIEKRKMDFKEAIDSLLEGKKIRRSCWEEGHFWALNKKGYVVNSIGDKIELNKYQILDKGTWEIFEDDK